MELMGGVGARYECPTNATVFHSDTPVCQSSFDWRESKMQLSVHDQGLQGGGIVHAAVGAIEEHYQLRYQGVPAKSFSVQQGLDCLHPDKLLSLTSGDVYDFIVGSGGLATQKDYPSFPEQGR